MTEVEKKLAELNGTLDTEYAMLVNRLIRARYSLSDELSLNRQRFDKPQEFNAFNKYVEECKAEAKRVIYGG